MILAWLQGVLGTNLEQKKDPSEEGSKSGGPGSNRQPLAWKAKALPLSYRRNLAQMYKKKTVFKGVFRKVLENYLKLAKFPPTFNIHTEVILVSQSARSSHA